MSARGDLLRRERFLRGEITELTGALAHPENACDRVELLRRRDQRIDEQIRVSIALARLERERRSGEQQRSLLPA